MKSKINLYALAILISILIVGVGYAAMTSLTLNINGTASATSDSDNFDVKFTGTPTIGGSGTTVASIDNITDITGRTAIINVSGLTTVGDIATATYTISNESEDIAASLSAEALSSNLDYFDVSYSFENTTLNAKSTTTVTITIELLVSPITDQSSNITVSLTATPVNPIP